MWQLVRALDADWHVEMRSAAATAAWERWATDPVLTRFADLGAVVDALRAGGHDPASTDRLLFALAVRARTDDVALRTMLQALLPGLVNVAKRLGRGVVDDELEADVLAEAVYRIRCYPLERRPRAIAANVVLDVFGRLARVRARRAAAPPVPLLPVVEAEDPSVEVCELVRDAVAAGQLRLGDAELLLSIAVGHETMRRRAEREGVSYGALNERWRRARDRLRRAVASGPR